MPVLVDTLPKAPGEIIESRSTAQLLVDPDATNVQENGTDKPPHPLTPQPVQLVERFIDEPLSLRVAIIGGGLAGINGGILLLHKVPGVKLTIYEKNHDFGGAWLENTYPGVRCDIPSHAYQSTFEPNTEWTDVFSYGSEIRDYWQGLPRKHGVYTFTKFSHKVQEANWDATGGFWRLTVQNLQTGEILHDQVEVVIMAVGRFNAWQLPTYPGISEYGGHLRHTSDWDDSFDLTGKKVAVIGNGASGIQVVPQLQKQVARLDHYARNGTWISSSLGGDDRPVEPKPIPQSDIDSFQDPQVYLNYRKSLEDKYWRRFNNMLRGGAKDLVAAQFRQAMKERLRKKPELLDRIIPDFPPECRRLTPGPGYLEALTEDNVEYITTGIKRFTKTGIETNDGIHREVDAIFCATGSNRDMAPQFNIQAGNQTLAEVWDQDGPNGGPYTYLGLATPGFPNLFFTQGPHGSGQSGTVTHSAETQITYIAKILRKLSSEGIKSIEPSERATKEFVEYSHNFFAKTVLTDNCSSWYNGGRPGARIHGLWPGSAAQMTIIRRNPRWEDWDYEYPQGTTNRLLWYFGSGSTKKESDPNSDMTPYLTLQKDVDLKNVHEAWHELL